MRDQAGMETGCPHGPQPRASLATWLALQVPGRVEWVSGAGVVGPGAERVRRRPRTAAGGRGWGGGGPLRARGPAGPLFASGPGKAGAGGAEGAAPLAWWPPPPHQMFPSRVDSAPLQNDLVRVPSPAVRVAPGPSAQSSPRSRTAAGRNGSPRLPLVAPAVPVPRHFPRWPPPGRKAQNRRSGPTCGVRARAPHRARRVFKLSCFRDRPSCLSLALF